ncbi:MAG: glycoside hydrolase family 16 protein [Saprospiraceae bacterium]|nr:glycoside hydrolase family 16 protein [Saprospiraceae bacterium]
MNNLQLDHKILFSRDKSIVFNSDVSPQPRGNIFWSSTLYLLVSIALVGMSCTKEEPTVEPEITCSDGLQNGSELGVDCGGLCPNCESEIAVPAGGYESAETYAGYNLVWSDEFEGSQLSTDKWSFHLGDGCPNLCGWGNNELQTYTGAPENIYLDQGYLFITAIQENLNGKTYSSSRIHTDEKFEFRYGRVDIRAVMPSATGTWVALWLLNRSYQVQDPGRFWPSGGEIDIVEYLGQEKRKAFGTAHFGTDFPANHRFVSGYYTTQKHPFDKAFYVYSIIWEEDRIQWLINDEVYHEIRPERTANQGQPYPFNDYFYLIMSLSVGGNLPVAPLASEYPSTLIVDYIRVFQID